MKTNKLTKIFFLIFLFQGIAFAGGSVIGNGAGIVENSFQFAYQNLHATFSECITQAKCELTEAETELVRKMRKVIDINRSNENRILFVTEKDLPGFFNTGDNESHRIAKTGLDATSPIYVNLDLVYSPGGTPAFDYATITSILVHELGHQTGETNHAKLDIVGSKIKKNILKKVQDHRAELSYEEIEVSIVNRSFPFRASDITISWQNVGSTVVTGKALELVKCKNPEDTLAGIEIQNGHFKSLTKATEATPARFNFGFWAMLTCYSKVREVFLPEQRQVQIEVDRNLDIKTLSVEDL